jgi:hypothetical protein
VEQSRPEELPQHQAERAGHPGETQAELQVHKTHQTAVPDYDILVAPQRRPLGGNGHLRLSKTFVLNHH